MPNGVTAGPPLRILMTTDTVGGVWRWSLDLAAGLADHGISTVLAVIGPSPFGARRREAEAVPGLEVLDLGGTLDWLAERPGDLDVAARRLALATVEARVDAVVLSTPALAGLVRLPVPVLAVAHSCLATWWRAVNGDEPMPEDFAWRVALHVRGLAVAAAVATPSRAFATATAEIYRLERPPVGIPNGRDVAPPTDERKGRFVFAAGRLWDEGKGFAVLDKAAAGVPWPVIAAGPTAGPNGARVAAEYVETIGTQSQAAMRRWFARAPIFVAPSLYEPFGLAVLEAAQAGCALVLSDLPSFRETWDGAALFVPKGEPRHLTAALRVLVADPARRAVLAAKAKARAETLTVAAMADRYQTIIRAMLRSNAVKAARRSAPLLLARPPEVTAPLPPGTEAADPHPEVRP